MLNFRRLSVAASRRGATVSSLTARNNATRHISSLATSPLGTDISSSQNNSVAPFSHREKSTIGLSSLSEPGINLFPTFPLGEEPPEEKPTTPVVPPEVKDAQLRADIRAMGHMLGQVIKQYEGQGMCAFWIYLFHLFGANHLFIFTKKSSQQILNIFISSSIILDIFEKVEKMRSLAKVCYI